MERLAGLYGHDSVDSPAIGQPAPAAFAVGKVVDEVPGQPVANIKIGIAAIGFGTSTVGRLGGVLDESVAVAGIVNRMRPVVVQCRRQAMPVVDAQAGLQ